jgi:CDGSH-type Zn-finger protein
MEKPIIAAKAPKVMEMEPGKYFWCACGRSQHQPFCDGSHKDTGIHPVRVVIEEKKEVHWCMCKQSKNKPFCDGTHETLE